MCDSKSPTNEQENVRLELRKIFLNDSDISANFAIKVGDKSQSVIPKNLTNKVEVVSNNDCANKLWGYFVKLQ